MLNQLPSQKIKRNTILWENVVIHEVDRYEFYIQHQSISISPHNYGANSFL